MLPAVPSEGSDAKSDIDEFLIAEYQHFADSFWRTEELGEKRLNFFISLLTAVVAGLVLLATEESGFSDDEVRWTAFGTGLALLCLGLSTLLRMLRRNEVTDQYKDAMDQIRASFVARYGLEGYKPFRTAMERPERPPRKLFTRGLAQTAALLNGLIAGALAAILLASTSIPWTVVATAAVFLIGTGAQFAFIHWRHSRR